MIFRPLPWLTFWTLLGLIILASLGRWQLDRLNWKLETIAKVDARLDAAPIPYARALQAYRAGDDVEYLPVQVEGRFQHDQELFLYGLHEGVPGLFVVTPFIAADGTPLLINRGFTPTDKKSPDMRADGQVEGLITVRGLARQPVKRTWAEKSFVPVDNQAERVWYRRDHATMGEVAGLSTAPVMIDSYGGENLAPWPKGGLTRIEFRNDHLQYAITWFGLAFGLFAVYLLYHVKLGRLGMRRS